MQVIREPRRRQGYQKHDSTILLHTASSSIIGKGKHRGITRTVRMQDVSGLDGAETAVRMIVVW